MKKRLKVTTEMRNAVSEWKAKGLTHAEIAQKVGASTATVSRLSMNSTSRNAGNSSGSTVKMRKLSTRNTTATTTNTMNTTNELEFLRAKMTFLKTILNT